MVGAPVGGSGVVDLSISNVGVIAKGIVACLVLTALSVSPAAAGKPLGSAEAPYYSAYADNYCYDESCSASANEETGVIELAATATDDTYDSAAVDGSIHAHPILSKNLTDLRVTARVDIDADSSASAENGTAFAIVNGFLSAGTGPCGCGAEYVSFRVIDSIGNCTFEECEDVAPSSLHGVTEFVVDLHAPDGEQLTAGDVHVTFELSASAFVEQRPVPREKADFYLHVDEKGINGESGTELDTYEVIVDAGPLEPIRVSNMDEAPQPEPQTPPAAEVTISAKLLSVELSSAPPEHLTKTPPGKLRENQTYAVGPAYEWWDHDNTCGNQPRCEPSSVDNETGRIELTLRSEDAPPVTGNNYEHAEGSLGHFLELTSAAHSMDLTFAIRLDAAQAQSVFQRSRGTANIVMDVVAVHYGCDYFYDCFAWERSVIVNAGTADGTTSRFDETLLVPLHMDQFGGGTIPPGTLEFFVEFDGYVNVHADDEAFAAAGLSYSTVSLDATLEGASVELDPAPWPI
jgi:hypothetical protein